MNHKIKAWYMDLKIRYKIMLFMLLVPVFITFIISATTQLYFTHMIEKRTHEDIAYSLDIIGTSLQRQINDIQHDISEMAVNRTIINIAQDIRVDSHVGFAYHYEDSQPILEKLIKDNHLVDSVAILGKNGEFYSTTDIGLVYQNTNMHIWSKSYTKDIHWLSIRQNPFVPLKDDVLPIIYPIGIKYGYLSFLPEEDELLMNIVVLIDAKKLQVHFNELNKSTHSKIILTDKDYHPISTRNTEPLFGETTYRDISSSLSLDSQDGVNTKFYSHDIFTVAAKQLQINDLRLVSIISEDELLQNIRQIQQFTLIVFMLALAFTMVTSLFVSRTITSPLRHLMSIIHKTERGDYVDELVVSHKDEVGILNTALFNMSKTIDRQFRTIKKEKQLKLKREIDILTRQINPHFLYNTLDCIRWEILNGNKEGASNMIESLGKFLRLGLNGSLQTLTIQGEVNHVQEYINIMNHRLHSNIQFMSLISEDIASIDILKLILQPLVENSIKHGFDQDTLLILSTEPTITVTAQPINQRLLIEVIDNGKGIDIGAAEKSISRESSSTNHIGLNNVYHRLYSYYKGDINMTFSSIPYYRNVVTIELPLTRQTT